MSLEIVEAEIVDEPRAIATITDLRSKFADQIADAQEQVLSGTTPKGKAKKRKGRGGSYDYVPWQEVVRTLNLAFWFWSFEVIPQGKNSDLYLFHREARIDDKYAPSHWSCIGRLTVKFKVAGEWIEVWREAGGKKELVPGMMEADIKESARQQSLRKCAAMFGVNLDVYEGRAETEEASSTGYLEQISEAKRQLVTDAAVAGLDVAEVSTKLAEALSLDDVMKLREEYGLDTNA